MLFGMLVGLAGEPAPPWPESHGGRTVAVLRILRFRPLLPLALVPIVLAGCTMCPNPFDYSGPVPNGSAPQNDFRARSNGITPIGAAPRPWPPLVKQHDKRSKAGTLGKASTAVARAPKPEAPGMAAGVALKATAKVVSKETSQAILDVVPEEPLDVAATFEAPAEASTTR